MENLNLHKQKLYALIIAAVGIISCLLPWWSIGGGSAYGYRIPSVNINGLHKLGIGTFLLFIAAAVLIFVMGDKTKPYAGQEKNMAVGAFGGAALLALLTLLFNMHYLSFGIFLAIIAGVVGAALVWGMIKLPAGNKPPSPPATPSV